MAKKLFREILLLLFAAIAMFALLEYRYRNFQTPVDHMMQRFRQRAPEAEILLMGNSHILPLINYLDSTTHSYHTASIALGGLDLFWSAVLIKKTLNQMPKLKTVILSVDPESMGYNQSFFRQEYVNRSFYRYTDTLYKPTSSDLLLARSNFFRSNRNTGFLFTGQQSKPSKELLPEMKQITEQSCMHRAIEHSIFRFNKELIPENKQLLEELVRECKRNNIRILLVTFPKAKCFYKYRDPENTMKGIAALNSVVRSEETELLDFTLKIYPDLLFRDADHLNAKGTKLIWADIEKRLAD